MVATELRFDLPVSDCCTESAITSKAQLNLSVPDRYGDNRYMFLRFLPDTLELRPLSLETLKRVLAIVSSSVAASVAPGFTATRLLERAF